MTILRLALAALVFGGVQTPTVALAAEAKPTMECKIGPAKRRFGGTVWRIYACEDGRSVAFRPGKDNPNNTAAFLLRWVGDHFELEGTPGDQPAIAERAYEEIADLSEKQIDALYKAAQAEN